MWKTITMSSFFLQCLFWRRFNILDYQPLGFSSTNIRITMMMWRVNFSRVLTFETGLNSWISVKHFSILCKMQMFVKADVHNDGQLILTQFNCRWHSSASLYWGCCAQTQMITSSLYFRGSKFSLATRPSATCTSQKNSHSESQNDKERM